ncbi:hypothetical protein ACIQTZ_22675 [Paenarthrobacter sp. NPDC090520]|uniref:hypothetical protein n=1 Tax=Paenarthrobacter sp. NPDC090520 TaxID=3364382 RepID=UPI00380AF9CF
MASQPADVDPAEFNSLNEDFYRADPAETIEHRLWMLAAFLADESTNVGGQEELSLSRDEAPYRKDRVQFAALESTLILHQAAETLLRLCLAHWTDAPCPWFEMAKLRQPRVFPKKVAHVSNTLDTDETISELLRIVSWSGDQDVIEAGVKWGYENGWERHREGLRELIRYCCVVIRDGADLYNAGKHGLAILPSEKGVSIGEGDVISVRGPSLTVIERQVQDGDLRWAKVTHWVKYKESIAITGKIASAVRSLWECGKTAGLVVAT